MVNKTEETLVLPNTGTLRPGCRLLYSLDHLASCRWAALPPGTYCCSWKLQNAVSADLWSLPSFLPCSGLILWSYPCLAMEPSKGTTQPPKPATLTTIFDVQNTTYVVFINTVGLFFLSFFFFSPQEKWKNVPLLGELIPPFLSPPPVPLPFLILRFLFPFLKAN